MRRIRGFAFVALGILTVVAVSGGAAGQSETGSLTVDVNQNSTDVVISVTQNSTPVEGAHVEVSSIGDDAVFDGVYTTGKDGKISIDSESVASFRSEAGVVQLRINVRHENTNSAFFTTVVTDRGLGESTPLGQRISLALRDSVATTRGTVEGSLLVTRIGSSETENASEVALLGDHANRVLELLRQQRQNERSLQTRFAMGNIDIFEFHSRMVEMSAREKSLKSDLEVTVRRLERMPDSRLRQNGYDPVRTGILYRNLRSDIPIRYEDISLSQNESS
ncbi:MAG: hypothetical protein SV253_01345 [Halobacteria archaeon]|nr:hypothetical protein [Halobacteria archaeon]